MADTTYGWTGPNDTGLPWPTEDSPPDGSAQIKKLAESIATYGPDRPDGLGEEPEITDANIGDQYICTDPSPFSGTEKTMGAAVWRFTSKGWRVYEGATPIYAVTDAWRGVFDAAGPTGVNLWVYRKNDTKYVEFSSTTTLATSTKQVIAYKANSSYAEEWAEWIGGVGPLSAFSSLAGFIFTGDWNTGFLELGCNVMPSGQPIALVAGRGQTMRVQNVAWPSAPPTGATFVNDDMIRAQEEADLAAWQRSNDA